MRDKAVDAGYLHSQCSFWQNVLVVRDIEDFAVVLGDICVGLGVLSEKR